jgi:hypothetical protein
VPLASYSVRNSKIKNQTAEDGAGENLSYGVMTESNPGPSNQYNGCEGDERKAHHR